MHPELHLKWNLRFSAALVMSLFFTTSVASGDLALQTLFEFGANPKNPRGGLVQGPDGSFYGTTTFGGPNGENGTVFRFTPAGGLSLLYSFSGSDGALPSAGLALGSDGVLYGTTREGGTNGDFGTVFRITTGGDFSLLHSFSGFDGRHPEAALMEGSDGNFYGVTAFGGSEGDNGTVFKITARGEFTVLFSFNGLNGRRAVGALLQGRDGNLYGTTSEGGPAYDGTSSFGLGTVFQITTSGQFTSLHSFSGPDGSGPAAGLAEGRDGNLYGSTTLGGANSDYGTIFKTTPDGALTTLFSFSGPDGSYPTAKLTPGNSSDEIWYGTTSGDRLFGGTNTFGTVFQFVPTGVLTTLVTFTSANGASPVSSLTQGIDGSLYGTTFEGGSSDGGTIFRLIEPPIIKTLLIENGIVIVTWTSIPGAAYRVEYRLALADSSWTGIVPDVVATSRRTSLLTPVGDTITRYYRIRLLP
jgi:uncharacterized repeat protein (TIGR03803 family)